MKKIKTFVLAMCFLGFSTPIAWDMATGPRVKGLRRQPSEAQAEYLRSAVVLFTCGGGVIWSFVQLSKALEAE